MKVIVRDHHSALVDALKQLVPEWDCAAGDIWSAPPADILVSPANCIGRMDGGIDQVYIWRFGWQLEKRLMRDILKLHGGRLSIGQAHLITTYDTALPLMVCAPTMDWPPGNVSGTLNAHKAMLGALRCAHTEGGKALGKEPTMLVPGLATGCGGMAPIDAAHQMAGAWCDYLRELHQ